MFNSLLDLFFPKVCLGCNYLLRDHEAYLCTTCRHHLPVTNFHFNKDETVKNVFYGRCNIEQATALLRFQKKGLVQQLLHNLKYKGHEDVSKFLGAWLGEDLKSLPEYRSIDVVIPVPLHPKKLRKRSYNQVAQFGKEIACSLNAEYLDNVLIKTTNTSSQVYKNRFSRWTNPKEQFVLQNSQLIEDKHILLVDDIITTGATMEACIEVLNSEKNHKISLAAMAIV
ncbi:MAG TPA: phosphoribosyltransferase family protein [Flavobacteriaceae bacterium]|nr:phosphoribosyltransferase family protein [Flavobacteriaceae bacterium]